MRIALIVNRRAGNGNCGKIYPGVAEYFQKVKIPFTPLFTEEPRHAIELARQAVQDGYEAVVSMGGDGTLNEVVNGLAYSKAILGVIPAGSGNGFGRTFGLKSRDIPGACQVIERAKVQEVDIGIMGDRFFINIAGAGFDAAVARTTEVWGKKYFRGNMAYIASGLRRLVDCAPQEVTIRFDDKEITTKVWLVAVANARYFGGELMIASQAAVDDGLFDICIVKQLSKLELLRMIPKVFTGGHIHHLEIERHRARRVYLSSPVPMATQADGEVLGVLPQEFHMAPYKQKVFLP